jgi:hypothetical protein
MLVDRISIVSRHPVYVIAAVHITVSGHVYDVTTGLVTTVIPATPVRASVPPE